MCACVRGQGVSVGKCKKVFAEVCRREWGREGEGKGEEGFYSVATAAAVAGVIV